MTQSKLIGPLLYFIYIRQKTEVSDTYIALINLKLRIIDFDDDESQSFDESAF